MSKIIEGAKEAVAVARGEIPAARLHHNGHAYVPLADLDAKDKRIRELEAAMAELEKSRDLHLRSAATHFKVSCRLVDDAAKLQEALTEIAESDDIENALDGHEALEAENRALREALTSTTALLRRYDRLIYGQRTVSGDEEWNAVLECADEALAGPCRVLGEPK